MPRLRRRYPPPTHTHTAPVKQKLFIRKQWPDYTGKGQFKTCLGTKYFIIKFPIITYAYAQKTNLFCKQREEQIVITEIEETLSFALFQ